MITERELKLYAIVGILSQVNSQSERYTNITDEALKKQAEIRLLKLEADYHELIEELRREEGLSL